MKRNFMKKAVAVSLSAAMALSLSSATALTASAATSTVAMAKTASVKVGKSKTLKLTKNTKKQWKVKAVSSTNKKFCTVKKTGNTKVKITGKKATTSKNKVTIRVRVKSSLKKVEKVLKCKVTVKGTTTTPDNPVNPDTPDNPDNPDQPVVETKKTVANQAELDAALADSNIKEITIQTADKVDLTIPESTHSDVDLIVDAASASITNSATFKSVTINNLSPDTWRERGKGNKFTFRAPNVHFVAEESADVAGIEVAVKGTVNITGKAVKAIPVTVLAAAADSVVTSEAPVAIIAAAQITLTLEKSATGSTVTLQRGAAAFSITFTNKTDNDIVVKTDDGKNVVTAPKNSTAPTTATAPVTTDPVNPSNPGGTTTPGTSKVSLTDSAYLNVEKVNMTAGTASITTVDATTTTGSATTTTGKAIDSYSAKIEFKAEGVTAKLQERASDYTDEHKKYNYKDLGTGVEYFVEVREGTADGKLVDGATFDSTKEFTFSGKGTDTEKKYVLILKAHTKENSTYYRGSDVKMGTMTVTVKVEDGKVTASAANFEKDIEGTKPEGNDKENYRKAK